MSLVQKLRTKFILTRKERHEIADRLEELEKGKQSPLTEMDREVIEHFQNELSYFIHQSETAKNNGLKAINVNKAERLSHLLGIVARLSK